MVLGNYALDACAVAQAKQLQWEAEKGRAEAQQHFGEAAANRSQDMPAAPMVADLGAQVQNAGWTDSWTNNWQTDGWKNNWQTEGDGDGWKNTWQTEDDGDGWKNKLQTEDDGDGWNNNLQRHWQTEDGNGWKNRQPKHGGWKKLAETRADGGRQWLEEQVAA